MSKVIIKVLVVLGITIGIFICSVIIVFLFYSAVTLTPWDFFKWLLDTKTEQYAVFPIKDIRAMLVFISLSFGVAFGVIHENKK